MKPKLKDLNENITCSICFGYLIDATTVIECLCTCELIVYKYIYSQQNYKASPVYKVFKNIVC